MATPTEQLQANLDRIFSPINEAIDLDLNLSISDRNRREQRAEELRREQRADKKADKDLARQEKRDLLRIAIENGVEIPDDATNNQIVKLIKERKEAIATNALKQTKSLYDGDRKRIESRRKELESKREKIINESLTPLQKAQILKSILSLPEYDKAIRKESRKKVDELMKKDLMDPRTTDSDVDTLVRGIYSDIKSNTNLFWYDKGGEKVADAFNESYNGLVGEQLAASKSASYAEWQEQMKELSRESQTIERGRSDALKSVIRDHGPYLSEDTIGQLTTEAEPLVGDATVAIPTTVRDSISKVGSEAAVGAVDPVTQPVEQPWSGEWVNESKPFIKPMIHAAKDALMGTIYRDFNAIDSAKNFVRRKITGGRETPLLDIDALKSPDGMMSREEWNALPTTEKDPDKLRAMAGLPPKKAPTQTRTFQSQMPDPNATTTQIVAARLQERGAEQPYPMTPKNTFAVIRLAAAKHNADPKLFGEFQRKILAGDKASIALWNQYVEDAQQLEQGAPVPP